jgi:hypothetical protein
MHNETDNCTTEHDLSVLLCKAEGNLTFIVKLLGPENS